MSVQRIQDLAAAAALTGTELVELEQSGGSVQLLEATNLGHALLVGVAGRESLLAVFGE